MFSYVWKLRHLLQTVFCHVLLSHRMRPFYFYFLNYEFYLFYFVIDFIFSYFTMLTCILICYAFWITLCLNNRLFNQNQCSVSSWIQPFNEHVKFPWIDCDLWKSIWNSMLGCIGTSFIVDTVMWESAMHCWCFCTSGNITMASERDQYLSYL